MLLPDLVARSWSLGQAAHLDGICRREGVDAPDYYRFLFGLCRATGSRKVLEIGTAFGGSSLAMWRAIAGDGAVLVTVDVTDESDPQLGVEPGILKVLGDSRSPDAIESVLRALSPPIDLLYIDTEHDFETTMTTYGIYAALLQPRFLVFDDITLNEGMRQFWHIMKLRYGVRALNVVEVEPSIRRHRLNPGFGVVWSGEAADGTPGRTG